jgi:hypothetical protein
MSTFQINITFSICKLAPSMYSSLHSTYKLLVGVQTTNAKVRNTKGILDGYDFDDLHSLWYTRKSHHQNQYSGPLGKLDKVRQDLVQLQLVTLNQMPIFLQIYTFETVV